ncbi:MAG: helix-turn-helix domain-containing protein [Halieaceae bacterium]|jgi:AraC-like DNA-binding protein|nr:helix-turn-helix domain-containing protein [Halieaceae bacterium]
MDASEFVARYIDAWNQRDARAIAEHFSDTGVYQDLTLGQQLNRDELLAHLDDLFKLENFRYELVGEVCAGPRTIAFQYRALPLSDADNAGSWHGAEFITLSANTVSEISDYYEQRGAAAPQSPVADAAGPTQVQRYAKSGLGTQQLEALKQQLDNLMREQRAYLRPDLTLPELADAMDCSVNHLSQVINAGFGMSFFDYLNRARVNDAMQLLGDSGGDAPTVLDVALQVGFNSTSTFYVAFKKVTGQTPAQYRRSLEV